MDAIRAHLKTPEMLERRQLMQTHLDARVESAVIQVGRPLTAHEVHDNQLENNRLFDLTEELDPLLRSRREEVEEDQEDQEDQEGQADEDARDDRNDD